MDLEPKQIANEQSSRQTPIQRYQTTNQQTDKEDTLPDANDSILNLSNSTNTHLYVDEGQSKTHIKILS